jgi:hypothetical protein
MTSGRPTNRKRVGLSGRWRIEEMDLWDRDALDLVEPAFLEIGNDDTGSFGFIAVRGWMDCRKATIGDRPGLEFTWDGNDECDHASGRGWVALQPDGSLSGHIFFHMGEDSGFTATRE